jgi:hypothetical protein
MAPEVLFDHLMKVAKSFVLKKRTFDLLKFDPTIISLEIDQVSIEAKCFTVFFLASLIVIGSGAFAGEPEFAVVLLVVDHLWDRLEHLFAVAANQRVRSV